MDDRSLSLQNRFDLLSSLLPEEEVRILSKVRIRRGENRISLLHDSLLCHILSFLTTKEVVCTSVLSRRWRNLWKWVPRLELDSYDFPNDKACMDFVVKFLNFQSGYRLLEFKLRIDQDNFENRGVSLYGPYLSRVIKRKIPHFQVENHRNIWIPLTLSVCEALVCLKLSFVRLTGFESLSLPCLKIMYLEYVIFPSDAAAEALISCSSVLEDLKISITGVVLRVCSHSLNSFTLKRAHIVEIYTQRLEYLSRIEYGFKSFKNVGMSDSVEVDIDVNYHLMTSNDLSGRNIIYNLLNNFSAINGDMTLPWKTLELIYSFRHMEPLPKFHDLTRLRATMSLNASLEVLPIVLESCPNLKHLTLELVNDDYPMPVVTKLSTVLSFCLVSSLESVEMETPITEKATEQTLVRYFLDNATSLKKLVLRVNLSFEKEHELRLLEQLFDSPRLSRLCQFEVIIISVN